MKEYCCINLENAVIAGWVREEVFVDDRPENNIFITEIVTKKTTVKHWLIYNKDEIQTKEIILKNCLWCSKAL